MRRFDPHEYVSGLLSRVVEERPELRSRLEVPAEPLEVEGGVAELRQALAHVGQADTDLAERLLERRVRDFDWGLGDHTYAAAAAAGELALLAVPDQPDRARAYADHAVRIDPASPHAWLARATVHDHAGDPQRALAAYLRAAMESRRVGDNALAAHTLERAALLLDRDGRTVLARDLIRGLLPLNRFLGRHDAVVRGCRLLLERALADGDLESAGRWAGEWVRWAAEAGEPRDVADSLYVSGRMLHAHGDLARATTHYERARALFDELEEAEMVAATDAMLSALVTQMAGLFDVTGAQAGSTSVPSRLRPVRGPGLVLS